MRRSMTISLGLLLVAAACSSAAAEEDVLSAEGALATSDAYFEAYNGGDIDASLNLMAPDVAFTWEFIGSPPELVDRDFWEERLAWNATQGTALTPHECLVEEVVAGERVTVSCDHGTHDAPSQAVGGPAVPTTTTFVIEPDGIAELFQAYGHPDFTHVGGPFYSWMESNHPQDADATAFGNWTSLEEARAHGLLRVPYAAEWAAWLKSADCLFPWDVCS